MDAYRYNTIVPYRILGSLDPYNEVKDGENNNKTSMGQQEDVVIQGQSKIGGMRG